MITTSCTLNTVNVNNTEYTIEEYFSVIDTISSTPKDELRKAFKKHNLDLNDKELDIIIKLMEEYYNDKSISLYERLPKSIKKSVNNAYRRLFDIGYRGVNNAGVIKAVFDNILSDVTYEVALNSITKQYNEETIQYNHKIRDMYEEMYEKGFKSIDDLKVTDPAQAEHVQNIKNAFEKAKTFEPQIEFLHKERPKLVKRYVMNYNSITTEFVKKSTVSPLKLHDTSELFDVIRDHLPRVYNSDDIKRFISLLTKSIMDLDYTDMANSCYVYRLIDSISQYRLAEKNKDIAVFVRIANVIEEINKVLKKYNNKSHRE